MARLGTGIEMTHGDNRSGARALFQDLWEEVGPEGDAFHRCAIAHAMADVQDNVALELQWDQRALRAAHQITGERAREGGLDAPVTVLFPSLHLNLANDYLRLHEFEAAQRHLLAGEEVLSSLAEDRYRQMIRDGLQRVRAAILEHRSTQPQR